MAEMGTDTATEKAGEGAATDQAAIDAAAATAAAEASAGDERSEEQKTEDAEKAAAAEAQARKARAQEKIDRTVKLAKTEAAKERDARHKIEIEKARLEGELEAIKRQGGKAGDRPETADPIEAAYAKQHPEPSIDQYETQEDYNKAVRAWDRGLVRFELEQSGKKSQETSAQEAQRQAIEELQAAIDAQRESGEEKYDDFHEVTKDLEFHPMAEAALAFSKVGDDIAYHLGSNPAEMARVKGLSPALQAKEIGRIESGIESGKIVVTKKPVRRVSTAPEPAPRPSGSARPAPKTIAEAKTSEERFAIWERENKK